MQKQKQIPCGNDKQEKQRQEVERIVALDWSGRVDAAGQRRHIWAGVWTAGVGVTLEAGRTRDEVAEWLIQMAAETPRMVIGIDCCFSFPAWFLREHRCRTVFDFWEKVAAGQGERWLARECEDVARDERFWGKPHKRPEQFCGEGYRRMMRGTDWENKVAQSLEGRRRRASGEDERHHTKVSIPDRRKWKCAPGSLRAMPFLLRLREAGFSRVAARMRHQIEQQKQIPCGDDNKKSNDERKDKCKSAGG